MLEKMYAAFLRLVKVIIAITFAMLIVIVFGNVVGRLLFHTGFAWGDEASRFLFVWDTFLASILVNDTYGQMGLDYLVQRLSGRKSTSVKIIGTSFVIIILGFNRGQRRGCDGQLEMGVFGFANPVRICLRDDSGELLCNVNAIRG